MADSSNKKKAASHESKKSNMEIMFSNSDSLTKRERRKKKQLIARSVGFALIGIEVIALIIFLAALFKLNMIPAKYMAMLIGILLLITVYNVLSQFTKAHWVGKVLAVLLAVVMFVGSSYIGKANSVISNIAGVTTKTDTFSLVVLATDSATGVEATKDYTFGYNKINNKDMAESLIQEVNTTLGTNVKTRTYDNWTNIVNALYNNEVKVIVFNESNRAMLEEQFTDFEEKTKVIYTKTFTTQIKENVVNKNTATESFTIYVSGNDDYGAISANGRSDVNIIATFNPKTRQVLMVSTPRDYWVPVDTLSTDSSGKAVTGYEKLTHAGNYGVDSSISTLESLYGIDIDYYVKVNFTGAVGVIDALGGITINSDVKFTNGEDAAPIAYNFVVGPNECDGEKALAFCRERQAFSDGDNQRGRNQMAAIEGMIDKATSTAILTQYNKVLDAVSGLIATNMPDSAISNLVKAQINDPTGWNIMSYSVSGTGATKTGQLFGLVGMSVIEPDYSTVNTAIELMSKVRNGEVFDIDQFLEDKALESGTTKAK
ncbi:MAG: LCP family protein [[Bacteroides] pectinophilus]|nr:LCP family protein [[Bacteroides] pectinophilus]